tara:strand:+ start:203 stop:682 length:480 start_codon:yes stop_codon:yes gene_type:complete
MINRIDTKSVKILRLVSGEEICCKFPLKENQLPDSSKLLRLQEPMLIKYVPRISEHGISDYIALVKWVGFTDEKVVTIPVDKIITICNATKEFTKRYTKLSVQLRESKQALPGFLQRDMKDEEWGDELDEIPPSNDDNINKKNLKDMVNWLNMPSKKIH